jgi:cytochrome c-type biogenesis protein CcsB
MLKILSLITNIKINPSFGLFVGLMLSTGWWSQASADTLQTLTRQEAQAFGSLSMLYKGRIAPVDSYAHDFIRKIYGKSTYKECNAVQVLTGWLFFPERWQYEPIFKIRSKELREKLGVERYASLSDFLGNADTYQQLFWGGGYDANSKAMREAAEKISLIKDLQSGRTLKIFPQQSQWFAPKDDLAQANPQDTLFMSSILPYLYESVGEKNHGQNMEILHKMAIFQQTRAANGLINERKIEWEIRYNRFDVCSILYKINLVMGLFAFGYCIFGMLRRFDKRWISVVLLSVLVFSFSVLTFYLALRWYISDHIPMSNGYETMMFLSWAILLTSIVLHRKFRIVAGSGLLISGLTLLVASLGFMNPHITPLMPVLLSPWMSIHVSLVMISYALLTFVFFNSLTAIILHCTHRNASYFMERLRTVNFLLLYPALALLCAGIFTGAVWANISWGRYWGWDPKEVWALITLLVYSFPLHGKFLPFFRKPLFYHVFLLLAFSCVLMTYFGVNYVLGGMHSYGG